MIHDYTGVTPETVTAEADAALARADELVGWAVAATDSPTFAGTLQLLELAGAEMAAGYGRSAFMAHVHPDPAVRDAGQEAEERMSKWRVTIIFREDVNRAVAAFAATDEAAALTGEPKRLLEHWLRDLRRAGHELPPALRAELELAALASRGARGEVPAQHQRVPRLDRGGPIDALAGLPDDFVSRLQPGSRPGTFRVSLDYPEYQPFMELAHDRALREQLFRKNWNKAVADQPAAA